MTASLLYHTNQIEDVQVKNVEYFPDKIVFEVLYQPQKPLCHCCGYDENSSKGVKIRALRMAPLGNKAAFLSVEIHRLNCLNCKHIWWPFLPFTNSKRRVTLSFEAYVVNLMRFCRIEHVARFLGVSWGTIKSMHKAYLQKEYKLPDDFESLRYIGFDEFSIRKGQYI